MTTAPAATPRSARIPMRVTVRTDTGRVHQYDAVFAHTFDAYDDALGRFPDVARIVVQAFPQQQQRRSA